MRIAPIISVTALSLALPACATRQAANEEIAVTAAKAGSGQTETGALDKSADTEFARQEPGPPMPSPPPPLPVMAQMVAPSTVASPAYRMARQAGATSYIPSVVVPVDPGSERYDGKAVSPVHLTASDPVSTFSVDVDTGAYANSRRFLSQGQLPPADAVRSEELVNYFRYDYPLPATRETPFSVTTDIATTPWNPATRLLRIGLRGYDLPRSGKDGLGRPPANLVFLVDVSGSMGEADKRSSAETIARLSPVAGSTSPAAPA